MWDLLLVVTCYFEDHYLNRWINGSKSEINVDDEHRTVNA